MQNKEGVMIAFLPTTTDWCKIELPHLTLVYAGKKKDLSVTDFNALAKDAASIAMLARPFVLRVSTQDIFGEGTIDNPKVRVLRFTPTSELWAMRRFVERWNKSSHPFNPHCTVGPEETFLEYPPNVIGFDRVMVAWGDEQMTFWLNK